MKAFVLMLYFFSLGLLVQGQPPAGASLNSTTPVEVSPFTIVDRGPHHRIWRQVTSQTNRFGETIYRTNSYTELGTGLNYWNGSEWVAANDAIEITPNGASATNTAHQVNFAANLNTAGAIDLTLPDGRHLRSQIVGLAYYDEANSNSVMFAETKDSIGQLLQSSNQVVYTNCFTDFQADVRYTHAKGKFEQDVILRSQPPSPAQYGLNPQSTLIEIWTEFLNAPEPLVTEKEVVVQGEDVRETRPDQNLDFGTMQIGRGVAFSTDSELDRMAAAAVVKKWAHIQGRTFLVEQLPLSTVMQEIQKLPPTQSPATNGPSGGGSPGASLHMKLPASKLQAKVTRPLLVAREPDSKFRPGFVMDYTIGNSTLTNFTFQSDTTYFVSNSLDLYGTNTIEGGTVIKTAPTSGGNTFHDTLISLTSSYRPAIFTSPGDDTVGTALTNGTVATNVIVTTYLSILNGGSVTNMRFCYAWNALGGWAGDVEVADCQFVDCNHPITVNSGTTTLGLHNILITMTNTINSSTNFCSCQPGALTSYSQAVNIYGENVTMDLDSQNLMTYFTTLTISSNTTVNFTNSIIVCPSLNAYYWTSLGSGAVGVTANTNSTFYATNMPAGLFQTVGAASYYLADGSPYRDLGTTNVSTALAADLKQKTTYPPVVINVPGAYFGGNLNFFPQAQRDGGSNPDLGYHYDPIDFAVSFLYVTNAIINVNPGTVLTTFSTSNYAGGIAINNGAQFICQGTPTSLCRIVEYNTVQEQSVTNWSGFAGSLLGTSGVTNSPYSVINCRFTDFSIMAQDANHVYGYSGGSSQVPNFQDCQFNGGILLSDVGINLTNCLLERVNSTFATFSGSGNLRNCLFWRGSVGTVRSFNATIQDNLFDQVLISDHGGYTYGYNGFCYTNATNFISLTNFTDVFFTNNVAYQTSWYGNYYQPTNDLLFQVGNTNASLLGLYQYTTQTNQTKEGTNRVTIGYHYVAANTNGLPMDTDGDGIPDYVEDANGNGLVDSGETNWQDPNDLGLNVVITRPANNSTIP